MPLLLLHCLCLPMHVTRCIAMLLVVGTVLLLLLELPAHTMANNLIVVPTNPTPSYIANYLATGNRTGIIEMYQFNSTNKLMLVVNKNWPFLTNVASASSTTASNTFDKRVMMSSVQNVFLQVGGEPPIANFPIGPIQLDPDFSVGGQDISGLTLSWGLDRIDQRNKPLNNEYYGFNATISAKRGVNLYILDTGIHASTRFPCPVFDSFSYYPSDGSGDCNGHGTHVAGIIASKSYGVSPNPLVNLHSVKILNCFGSGDTASVAAGLLYVLNNYQAPAIINLSVGMSGIDTTLRSIVIELIARGIVVVGAAGNQADDACRHFPAGIPGVIGVGALDQTSDSIDHAASYSNFGSCVDLFAPGTSIQSLLPNDLTGFKSGTSMASPFVTGAIVQTLGMNTVLTATEAALYVLGQVTADVVVAEKPSFKNDVLYVQPLSAPPPPPPPPTSTSTTTGTNFQSTTTTAAMASTTTGRASTTTMMASTTMSSTTTNAAASSTGSGFSSGGGSSNSADSTLFNDHNSVLLMTLLTTSILIRNFGLTMPR